MNLLRRIFAPPEPTLRELTRAYFRLTFVAGLMVVLFPGWPWLIWVPMFVWEGRDWLHLRRRAAAPKASGEQS